MAYARDRLATEPAIRPDHRSGESFGGPSSAAFARAPMASAG